MKSAATPEVKATYLHLNAEKMRSSKYVHTYKKNSEDTTGGSLCAFRVTIWTNVFPVISSANPKAPAVCRWIRNWALLWNALMWQKGCANAYGITLLIRMARRNPDDSHELCGGKVAFKNGEKWWKQTKDLKDGNSPECV